MKLTLNEIEWSSPLNSVHVAIFKDVFCFSMMILDVIE